MSKILIAPHSDDEALFSSYIIMREKPTVYILTDGTSHVEKFGISIKQRRQESIDAMKLLGINVIFLGMAEEEVSLTSVFKSLDNFSDDVERVYVPAEQGGHEHHDILSQVAGVVFGDKCLYYSTYQKDNLIPIGELEIKPTAEEKKLKEEVLKCYSSQLRINPHHFEAIKNKSEYLNLEPDSWKKYV